MARKYTISPGSRGSMAKSRSATVARGPQARGLPWRAEMQPNCPGYQERLCLSSWNRYSTRTGKARKNRTRKERVLARKNDRNFQPCEIAISHGSNQLIQCRRSKFRSKVQGYMWDRRISQRSSVDLIGQCHGYRHVTYDKGLISKVNTQSQSWLNLVKSTIVLLQGLVETPFFQNSMTPILLFLSL